MSRPDSTAAWRHFVRNVLGCGCPDEVLRTIARSPAVLPGGLGSFERIDVGGRLLVYVTRAAPSDPALRALLRAGKQERDTAGFNRFRLAIAADDPAPLRAAADAVLAELAGDDDKMHVHVVSPALVPRG